MSNIRISEGTSYHPGWTVRDAAGKPINLSGAVITFAVYSPADPTLGSPVPWLQKNTAPGGGIIITDSLNGIFRVDIDHADTADRAGAYPWEINIQTPDDDTRLLDKGIFVLLPRRLDTLDLP